MFHYRSAVLMLIGFIPVAETSRASQSAESPACAIHASVAGQSKPSIASSPTVFLSRGATLSRYKPWRKRLKSVLQETNLKIFEECDFRFTVIPDRRTTSDFDVVASCHLALRARCAVDLDCSFPGPGLVRACARPACPSSRRGPTTFVLRIKVGRAGGQKKPRHDFTARPSRCS